MGKYIHRPRSGAAPKDIFMPLDVPTLIFAGSFVGLIGTVVLLGAWLNMGQPPALLWWAGSAFLFATGVGCIGFGVAQKLPTAILAGGFVSNVSTVLLWASTRAFQREPIRPSHLVAGLLAWAIADWVLLAANKPEVVLITGFVVAVALLLAAEYELWRGRAEALTARWGLMALLALHAVILVGGAYDTLYPSLPLVAGPQLNSWFGLIHFEGLIFSVGAPVLIITMCRERITLDYERASHIDSLTGIANRRALFAAAERLLNRCRTSEAPLSVIEFDLDRFKAINDAHGHAVGDAVLRAFVGATRNVLRQSDFFGRHGGEEFAAILPGTTIEAAYVIAERARHAFAEAASEIDGRAVNPTVSAGVAAMKPGDNFGDVLDNADRALYRAKGRGRNRVERAEDAAPATDGTVIRVA